MRDRVLSLLLLAALSACSRQTPPRFPHQRASFDGRVEIWEGSQRILAAELGYHRARGRIQLVFREEQPVRTLLRLGAEAGEAFVRGAARPLTADERALLDLCAACFDPGQIKSPSQGDQGYEFGLGARKLRMRLEAAPPTHGH